MSKLQNESFLIKTLDLLRDDIEHGHRGEFFHKFYDLKEQYYTNVSDEVKRLYKSVLKAAIKKYKTDRSMNNILSSVISLSHNLIPTNVFDQEMDELFQICVDLDDSRTKANALTAIGEYNPESQLFKDHFDSQSNRVAADALMVSAKRSLDNAVLAKIEQFLKSSNPYFVSSGVYVVAMLSEHFKKGSQIEEIKSLSAFYPIIHKFSTHPHEMVRKRALQSIPMIDPQRNAA